MFFSSCIDIIGSDAGYSSDRAQPAQCKGRLGGAVALTPKALSSTLALYWRAKRDCAARRA